MNARTALSAAPAVQTSAPQRLPRTPVPDQPARFAVMGLLAQHARVWVSPGGAVLLQVLIAQHLQAHPEARHVLATLNVGSDSADSNAMADRAEALAARLRRGTEVVATGGAMLPGEYHGDPVNVLHDVRSVLPAEDVRQPQLLPPEV